MILNDYTYMIEVERHRDAIDFAARQRMSRLASKQTGVRFVWMRAVLTWLGAAFHRKVQSPAATNTHHGPGHYGSQAA